MIELEEPAWRARAAAHQVIAHLHGRPRTLGGGFHHVQALALLARADRDPARLDEALSVFRERSQLNFDQLWFDGEDMALAQAALAAEVLGREDAPALLREAAALGSGEAARRPVSCRSSQLSCARRCTS